VNPAKTTNGPAQAPIHLDPNPDSRSRTHSTHCVIIPSYNTGSQVYETVKAALRVWAPVWVVTDGATDGTDLGLRALAENHAGLHLIVLPENRGKGAAILAGLHAARDAGYTHTLTMDADGQHPVALIDQFITTSKTYPDAMVLGQPVFDESAPSLRVYGRRISNAWTNLETLGAGIGDSLFGFRVYPIDPLIAIMERRRWMRRFDFDTEAVVRLAWNGVTPINLPAPVRYFSSEEGGVSHFKYLRDNLLLTWMHTRLVIEFVLRLPWLVWLRFRGRPPFQDKVPSAPNR